MATLTPGKSTARGVKREDRQQISYVAVLIQTGIGTFTGVNLEVALIHAATAITAMQFFQNPKLDNLPSSWTPFQIFLATFPSIPSASF